MIFSSTPTPTKTTATTPTSHTTTSTPLGKETTPSLAHATSQPTRLKSTLFSEGTQTREEGWGWQREGGRRRRSILVYSSRTNICVRLEQVHKLASVWRIYYPSLLQHLPPSYSTSCSTSLLPPAAPETMWHQCSLLILFIIKTICSIIASSLSPPPLLFPPLPLSSESYNWHTSNLLIIY